MDGDDRTVAIVGGGFSGAVLALKLARAQRDTRVVLIERTRRAGVGLAYGACAPTHLLNVPASRMECGLDPSFQAWLLHGGHDLSDALAESGGDLHAAFVPRGLFGCYVEARVAAALSSDLERGLHRVRGEAVRLLEAPARGVLLSDGRQIEADVVVLATGNMAPGRPAIRGGQAVLDGDAFVADPWASEAFEGLSPDAPVLVVGAGLTMVDIVLRLVDGGHRGSITALSRHGWAPTRHAPGGAWAPFLAAAAPRTPLEALRVLRRQLALAAQEAVPWQRVFDAARPDVARIWRSWDAPSRRRFLRHLRTLWDVHRHRMAPRIADRLEALLSSGQLTLQAGRIAGLTATAEGVSAQVHLRHGGASTIGPVARVVNCTGPRSDFKRLEAPLYGYLRRRDLIRPDPLALGLETEHCAVLNASGAPSAWLYAIGPLTRPALWEVTAAPEINAQVDALIARIAAGTAFAPSASLELTFADLGAGI